MNAPDRYAALERQALALRSQAVAMAEQATGLLATVQELRALPSAAPRRRAPRPTRPADADAFEDPASTPTTGDPDDQ